jgi:hypothetical protein
MFIYLVYFLAQGVTFSSARSFCTCGGYDSVPPLTPNTSFVPQEEIINGTSYGVPVVIGNVTVLTGNFIVTPSITDLLATCPLGYRTPTQDELRVVFRTNDFMFLKNTMKILPDKSYVSAVKSSPTSTAPNVFDSWNFKGSFMVSDNGQIQENDVNTFFENPTYTKCVQDINQRVPLRITQKDFVAGFDYEVGLINKNYLTYGFRFKNQTIMNQDTFFLNYTELGCVTLEFFALTLNNQTIYNCRKLWVNPYTGSEAPSTLAADTIKYIATNTSASRMIYLFWNRGNAPISPIQATGGFYLAFTGTDNYTYVQEYNSNLDKIKEVNLNITAFVCDIIANNPGFTLYVKDVNDNNYAYLIGFNKNFTQKYRVTIMNNGITPTAITQQLSFYDKTGNIFSGMEAMFAASSGKLSYGRGRVGLLFSHYNAFGTPVLRNDHQGDTFYTFDRKGGNETMAWNWKTSHSLYQAQFYDGQYFITASLGDMYPTNIKVCVVDGQSRTDDIDGIRQNKVFNPTYCVDIVPGNIPGNAAGASCGRIGGIFQQGANYGLVYARKPCQLIMTSGQQSVSNDNEIALITFKIDPNMIIFNINKVPLGLATGLTGIRASKYGNNIFITYLWVQDNFGLGAANQYIVGESALETQYAMLVDFNGVIVTSPYVYAGPINVSPSDDMKTLNDGRVIWTFVDRSNNLNIFYLPAPPAVRIVGTSPVREDTLILPPKFVNVGTNINRQVLFAQLKIQYLVRQHLLKKRAYISKRLN